MSEGKKIALVTGANKGIGFETARQLGVQDITILVGARNQARGEAAIQKLRAEKIEAVVVQLDVTNQASIDAAVAFIDQTYGRLDMLVNNAGISVREWSTLPSQLSLEDLQKTFATNVFGVFAVTKAMLPLLRRSQAGRIVNLSSEMGSLCINSDADSSIAKLPPTLAYNASNKRDGLPVHQQRRRLVHRKAAAHSGLQCFQNSPERSHRFLRQRATRHPHQSQLGQPWLCRHRSEWAQRLSHCRTGRKSARDLRQPASRWTYWRLLWSQWTDRLVTF
jgi:hypothetical protein